MNIDLTNKAIKLDVLNAIIEGLKNGYTVELNKANQATEGGVNEGALIVTQAIFGALEIVKQHSIEYSQLIDTTPETGK